MNGSLAASVFGQESGGSFGTPVSVTPPTRGWWFSVLNSDTVLHTVTPELRAPPPGGATPSITLPVGQGFSLPADLFIRCGIDAAGTRGNVLWFITPQQLQFPVGNVPVSGTVSVSPAPAVIVTPNPLPVAGNIGALPQIAAQSNALQITGTGSAGYPVSVKLSNGANFLPIGFSSGAAPVGGFFCGVAVATAAGLVSVMGVTIAADATAGQAIPFRLFVASGATFASVNCTVGGGGISL
ncbi:MAG: hypothetical protein ACYDDA_13305 [Acidiferrobacteraceae bacterium]